MGLATRTHDPLGGACLVFVTSPAVEPRTALWVLCPRCSTPPCPLGAAGLDPMGLAPPEYFGL